MNRMLFWIGAILIMFSFFVWLAFFCSGSLDIPFRELTDAAILGGLLMLPELYHQLRQLLSSRSTLDD